MSQAQAIAATPPPPPTQQQREERDAVEKKMLTALIEAAAVSDPALKARVTLAAVWQYMRLPDSSFGWVPRAQPGEPTPPLPSQCKALCIITTLALGLTPGLGHVLWLGNKCFIDVYGKRVLARRQAKFLDYKLRALEPWERQLFGLHESDGALAFMQRYKLGEDEVTGTGYGLIDSNATTTASGKPKPGFGDRKDTAMTLITRGERDFLNRHFPIDGVADMPDNPRQYVEELEPQGLSSDATTVRQLNEDAFQAAAVALERDEATIALEAFDDAERRVIALGGDPQEILGVDLETLSPVDLAAAADCLEEWIIANKPNPPEPTKGKGRGRPPKDKPAELALTIDVGGTVTPPTAAAPAPVPEPALATPPPPPAATPIAKPAPAVDGPQGHLNPIQKARATKRLQDAIARVEKLGGAPMRVLGRNPHNDIAEGSVLVMDATSDILDAWAPDKPSVVERNVAARSTPPPMDVPPIEDGPAPAGGPVPGSRTEAKAQTKATTPPPPAAPTPAPKGRGNGAAYDMIDRALGMGDLTAEVRDVLTKLRGCKLSGNDHLYIPKALRLAKGGSMRDLNEILSKSPPMA